MNPEDEGAQIRDCNHVYHKDCLNTWLEQKNECPLCKAQIDCYKEREEHRVVNPFLARMRGDSIQDMAMEMQANLNILDLLSAAAGHPSHVNRDREMALTIMLLRNQLAHAMENNHLQMNLFDMVRNPARVYIHRPRRRFDL